MKRGGVLLLVPLLALSLALAGEEGGKPEQQHGWLGVYSENLSEPMLIALNIEGGVLVTSVVEESPAQKVGLEKGDVLLTVDGQKVEDPGRLRDVIGERPEKTVNIALRRRGAPKTVSVTLGVRTKPEFKVVTVGEGGEEWLDLPEDAVAITRKVLEGLGPDAQRIIELEGQSVKELKLEVEKLKVELEQLRQQLKEQTGK